MARQDATLWRPDTCDCEFYIRVDSDGNPIYLDHNQVIAEHQARINAKDPTANPVISRPAKACDVHSGMGHSVGKTLFNVVKEENQRKNIALDEVRKALDIPDDKAGEINDHCVWSFDQDRNLNVMVISPLAQAKRSALQAVLHSKFGEGKVRIS